MDKAKFDTLSKLSFEDALEKLEEIVEKMEEGRLPLDSMIEHFEEGSALSEICSSKLEKLERKIEILVKNSKEGLPVWKDFEAEPQKVAKAPSSRSSAGATDSDSALF